MAGRRRKYYLTYEMAKEHIREVQKKLGVTFSRQLYIDWHHFHKPTFLPGRPYRVYKDWVSWNDFLGNNNKFGGPDKSNYVPYWEAVRWAQKYCKKNKITTINKWQSWYKEVGLPENIPKRPDQIYEDFWENGGWTTWLGKNVRAVMKSEKEEVGLLAICTISSEPKNVLEVVIAKDGINHLKEILERRGNLTVLKIYRHEVELQDAVKAIFDRFTYDRGGMVYMVPNVNELLFELSNILLLYTGNNAAR